MNLVVMGILSFSATNIDDFLLLIFFFSKPQFNFRKVVLAQFLGISTILGLSLWSAYLGDLLVPREKLNLLGLIPLCLGLKNTFSHYIYRSKDRPVNPTFGSGVLGLTAVVVANGGDNLGVYIPIFATSSGMDQIGIISVYLVMTAVWCMIAYFLVKKSVAGLFMKRIEGIALSFVLIFIGLYILIGKD